MSITVQEAGKGVVICIDCGNITGFQKVTELDGEDYYCLEFPLVHVVVSLCQSKGEGVIPQ